ncbi:MAG: AAA family ATPase [Verrucomicrobia bacterium]|nr:AAA family ATPase [Verrucomicrobiota bacterium]
MPDAYLNLIQERVIISCLPALTTCAKSSQAARYPSGSHRHLPAKNDVEKTLHNIPNETGAMKLKIASLSIERLRSFGQLKIEGLGRVNLITGRNNSGKSSVIESLRILASDASPSVLFNILRYREEDIGEGEDVVRPTDADTLSQITSLFQGLPQLSELRQSIVLATDGGEGAMRLAISVGWFSEEREQDGTRRLVPQQQELFSATELIPALVIEIGSGRRVLPLNLFRRFGYRGRSLRPEYGEEPRLPCVFVSPYGGERTVTLGPLWDKITLSDREKDVVEALKIIAPDITAVSMVGGEGPRQIRTAIVRSGSFQRPVSLRSFGDGLNRLFGIVLSLVNAKDGLLLIDEFENGLHHSVQVDVWRAIFRLSQRLNIQVFATSHSWDCIQAFQIASAATPGEGVLIRLVRKDNQVFPTIFREDELAVATRDRIEVR